MHTDVIDQLCTSLMRTEKTTLVGRHYVLFVAAAVD